MRAFLSVIVLPGFVATIAPARADSVPIVVASPDGRLKVSIALDAKADGASVPVYDVTFLDRPVLLRSPLGVDMADGTSLGIASEFGPARTRSVRETYEQRPGKRHTVLDHFNEAVIPVSERGGGAKPDRRWELVARAYNDGVALRYEVPAQEGWAKLEIACERTGFRFPEGTKGVVTRMPSYATPHEGTYQTLPIADLPKGQIYALPLLAEVPGAGFAAVLDANLNDYAGLYLAREAEGAVLAAKLSPLPKEPKVAVRHDLPHRSPWRAILVGDGPGPLIESDLVLNLNDPCAIADTSWIKTGKTTFPWWNGFYERNAPFKMGLNTETAKYYIDFCAESGIPYHSLDGVNNTAWYGGKIRPYTGAGITEGGEGLDLQEVLRYAKSKGVKIRLWMNSAAAAKHMERAFPLYREWGVEGVMVDFFDRDDQEIMNFTRRLVKTAADNHLTITLHNCHEPTGLERTYPNLLTHEAVRNLEYDKWDKVGILPEHQVTVPYTRMLAGPLDFHQGSFRGVPVEQYRPRDVNPLVMGGVCRMLASYVVYQDHLSMVADYPSAYRGHRALPLLVAIPTDWDDTRFVAGNVGESVAIARRSGDDWWLGVMTDRQARQVVLPLKFLGGGHYLAEMHVDDPGVAEGWRTRREEVRSSEVLALPLPASGGALIHLIPARKD